MKKAFYIVIIFLIVFSSCIKEDLNKIYDEYIWNPTLSIPVRDMDLSIDDFIASTTFYDFYKTNHYALISKYIDFNYSNLVDGPEKIEKLLYRFDVINNFPARLEVETHFLDANNNKLNTKDIFDEPINVNSATVDSEGNIKLNQHINEDITIDESHKSVLNQIRKVLLVVYFYDLDENPEVIKKLNDYNVFISVGVRAEIKVPTNQ